MHVLLKYFVALVMSMVFWFLSVGVVEAEVDSPVTDGVVIFADNFSDPTLAKWESGRLGGGQWQVVDGVLRGKVPSASSISELLPKPELWHESWGNYRFSLDLLPVSGVDRNLGWNYQDPRNWYEAHFVGSSVELYRLKDGQTGYVSNHQFFLTPQVWHHVVVEVSGRSMKLWVDGWQVADVTDWYGDDRHGSIALKVGTGAVAPAEVWFDNVVVELVASPADQHLAVELIKQSDPLWSGEIYDHGEHWSTDPTINRWGCALTSLVMILKYYGFTTLPSGEQIDPASLNRWLISQPDGYVADGWVNWLAAERLTRQLTRQSPSGGLPLKFTRWSPTDAESDELQRRIQTEIEMGRPVIIALANHFLVGTGTIGGGNDILINDPWYDARLLGQHSLAGRPPQSLRLIEPYGWQLENASKGWLLATKGVLAFTLKNELGEEITQRWEKMIGPERGGVGDQLESRSQWQVWWLPNLSTGKYELEVEPVSGAATTPEINWYVYDETEVIQVKNWLPSVANLSKSVIVTAGGRTNWLDGVGLVWSWADLFEWWQRNLDEKKAQDLNGWLRIHYLLKQTITNTAPLFDERYRQLLDRTALYYWQDQQDQLMEELRLRLSLTGTRMVETD